MIDLKKDRQQHRSLNKRFRRARRLYVYFMRHRINIYRDDVLDFMQERMQERGVYSAKSDPRGIRQSILTYLYHAETARGSLGFPWHSWLMEKAWDIYKGYSKPIKQKRA